MEQSCLFLAELDDEVKAEVKVDVEVEDLRNDLKSRLKRLTDAELDSILISKLITTYAEYETITDFKKVFRTIVCELVDEIQEERKQTAIEVESNPLLSKIRELEEKLKKTESRIIIFEKARVTEELISKLRAYFYQGRWGGIINYIYEPLYNSYNISNLLFSTNNLKLLHKQKFELIIDNLFDFLQAQANNFRRNIYYNIDISYVFNKFKLDFMKIIQQVINVKEDSADKICYADIESTINNYFTKYLAQIKELDDEITYIHSSL